MPARQPVPTLWLMTDERADATLKRALLRLPRGAGVIFRHHATDRAARRRRFEAVRRIARARRLVLILAGDPRAAIGWRADGWHGRGARRVHGLRTAPAHGRRELVAAQRAGADAIFLSPIFATRSHPDARALGPVRFGSIASSCTKPLIIALGGMSARRYRRLKPLGASGWAAIDAWSA